MSVGNAVACWFESKRNLRSSFGQSLEVMSSQNQMSTHSLATENPSLAGLNPLSPLDDTDYKPAVKTMMLPRLKSVDTSMLEDPYDKIDFKSKESHFYLKQHKGGFLGKDRLNLIKSKI